MSKPRNYRATARNATFKLSAICHGNVAAMEYVAEQAEEKAMNAKTPASATRLYTLRDYIMFFLNGE